jgi:hypothetical protein
LEKKQKLAFEWYFNDPLHLKIRRRLKVIMEGLIQDWGRVLRMGQVAPDKKLSLFSFDLPKFL